MAAKGLITFHELRAKITALEETRETAQRRKLEALNRRHEKVEELKRDRNTILDSLVATAPEALDALTPETRSRRKGASRSTGYSGSGRL